MKVLFDTNVILDVLLDRQSFSDDAAQLMSSVECSEIQCFIFTLRNFAYSAVKGLQALFPYPENLMQNVQNFFTMKHMKVMKSLKPRGFYSRIYSSCPS